MPPDRRVASPSTRRNFRVAVAAVVILVCLAVIASLSLDVQRRLAALERANSDNVHWLVAQAEVEILRLQLVTQTTAHDPLADLDALRRRFDLLFSRVAVLQRGPVYARILEGPDYAAEIGALRAFLDRTVPLIDGPDAELRAALPGLLAELPDLHGHMRSLALRALGDFARLADDQRRSMAQTLIRLAGLTILLVVALSILALGLLWSFRRTQAQAEINRRTGARLETVVNTSADGIIVTDTAGKILDFNPAAEAMFGYSRAALIGRHAITTLCPPDVAAAQQHRVEAALPLLEVSGAEPFRLEMDARRADGSRFPIEVSLAAAGARDGDSGGPNGAGSIVVGFLRDISERRRAEQALNEALERAQTGERAKAEFLAIMSHEMRTPLNGMLGSVELLADTGLDDRQRRLVSVLERSGQILLGHMNGVLDIAQAEAGQTLIARQPVDLDLMVADCVANQADLAAMTGTRIRVAQVSGPIGWGMADPTRLGQILLNLLGNAVKFTRAGTITVETEVIGAAGPDCPARMVEFRVIDSGAGIAQDQLDRIFEDFVTLDGGFPSRGGGTGLGLGISRRLARAMGGEIGAESVEGEGSLFWLRLPLPAVPAEAAADGDRSATEPGPMQVLVIEDNAINRFILRSFLESAGHRVTEAVDGEAGVAEAGARRFDVILTDISMPAMDGVETARRIRQGAGGAASRGARILALTAHALPEEEAQFREAGMACCLIKPVSRAVLLAALAENPVREAPATAAGVVLDTWQLQTMAEQIGKDRLAGLLGRMLAEGHAVVARIEGLRDALPDGVSGRELARLCHQLAGSAATFGALALRTQLIDAGSRLRQGDAAGAQLALVPALWQATATELSRAREDLAAAT
ncbi:MAG TPA: ATP-binding protein [Paracoccaceae bacterium]